MTDYGRDVSCTTSLRSGRTVSGTRLVAEACYRRLTTPRGMLRGGEEEANYGLDLTELVGHSNPARLAASLPSKIRSELTKDERIVDATVTVETVTDGPSTSFIVTIEVETDDAETFDLVLSVSDVSVELLGITE